MSGKSNFHLQKRKSASLGGGATKRRYSWSTKAIRRNTTGTGRMRSLRHVQRKEKNGYRQGTQASKKNKTAWATNGIFWDAAKEMTSKLRF